MQSLQQDSISPAARGRSGEDKVNEASLQPETPPLFLFSRWGRQLPWRTQNDANKIGPPMLVASRFPEGAWPKLASSRGNA